MADNYRRRVLEEHSRLAHLIKRLQDFVISDEYDTLPEIDRKDLKEQLKHMEAYYSVLTRRVSRQ